MVYTQLIRSRIGSLDATYANACAYIGWAWNKFLAFIFYTIMLRRMVRSLLAVLSKSFPSKPIVPLRPPKL